MFALHMVNPDFIPACQIVPIHHQEFPKYRPRNKSPEYSSEWTLVPLKIMSLGAREIE